MCSDERLSHRIKCKRNQQKMKRKQKVVDVVWNDGYQKQPNRNDHIKCDERCNQCRIQYSLHGRNNASMSIILCMHLAFVLRVNWNGAAKPHWAHHERENEKKKIVFVYQIKLHPASFWKCVRKCANEKSLAPLLWWRQFYVAGYAFAVVKWCAVVF